MALTWRDGVGTLLMAALVAVTLAVTNGWGWPLLNDARAGVIGVTILGFASCQLAAKVGPETRWANPFLVVIVLLGIAALGLVIGGLVFNSMPVLVYLTSIVVVMWLVATVHHIVEVGPAGRPAIQSLFFAVPLLGRQGRHRSSSHSPCWALYECLRALPEGPAFGGPNAPSPIAPGALASTHWSWTASDHDSSHRLSGDDQASDHGR